MNDFEILRLERDEWRKVAQTEAAKRKRVQVERDALRAALKPFADLPMPERDGFTLYTRAEIEVARAALPTPEAQ